MRAKGARVFDARVGHDLLLGFQKRFQAYTYERVERDISTQPMRPRLLNPSDSFSMYMMRVMHRFRIPDV